MEKFPYPPEGFRDLLDIITEPMVKAKLLLTAVELCIFTNLQEPKTAVEVAEMLGLHPINTEHFLNGLCACEWLTKENGKYFNSNSAANFLVANSEFYIGDSILSLYQWIAPVMEDMIGFIKTGPSDEKQVLQPDLWAQSALSLAALQKMGRLQMIRRIISQLEDFQSFKKMLDLGCGPGLIGMAIVDAHPSMKGVLFDQEPVIKLTAQYVKKYSMEDRISLMSGNMLTEGIGSGYDLIFAGNVLGIAKDDLDAMIKKIYDAMNPGGTFISCNGVIDPDVRPSKQFVKILPNILMDFNFLLARDAVTDAAKKIGFRTVTKLCDGSRQAFDIAKK